ncbi:MAG: FapA family protein [Bacteroidetes bacterium]|nr:FapA family protein [Bacteroidota bacterium]
MTDVIAKGIRVEISQDGYEAYIVVDESDLQPSDIQAALETSGVVYGLDSNSAFEALNNLGKQVLVASGSRHTDGNDGWFERIKKREETDGEAKFGISNVYAGETFGIIHKPSPGSVGVDVYGKKIQPKSGKSINIFTGPNIKRVESEDLISLEAMVDGNLKMGSASAEIITEYVIRGDIDYSDGEIEFAGSLKILGDVKGSGSLKVKHDVYVQGSVEDARIIAGGTVKIKGSFVGRGDGLIRAAGDVELNVVLNQMIESGSSITVIKECVNAHLIATEDIVGHNATVMGGVVTAGNRIEIRTLGGELYSTTKVKLGTLELLTEDIFAINKEIDLQKKASEQLKNEIYLLVRDRIDNNNFTNEKANLLKLLQTRLQEQNESIKQLTERKQDASAVISRKRNCTLTVLGNLHQSVVVEINGVRFALKQSYNNVTFQESKGEIIRTNNL